MFDGYNFLLKLFSQKLHFMWHGLKKMEKFFIWKYFLAFNAGVGLWYRIWFNWFIIYIVRKIFHLYGRKNPFLTCLTCKVCFINLISNLNMKIHTKDGKLLNEENESRLCISKLLVCRLLSFKFLGCGLWMFEMLRGMRAWSPNIFGMQALYSKKQEKKLVWGLRHPPWTTP